MKVEIVYALPEIQKLIEIEVEETCLVQQAIELSGILEHFPGIDLINDKVGIFSRVVSLDDDLREGDRIEIYRPLIADPKEMRRRKVEEKKRQKSK